MCDIYGNQMRILRSCFQTELGNSIFSTQHKIYQIVNLNYVEPMTVISKFGIERIPWLYKAIKNLLMLWMEAQQNNYNHNNNKAYKQI